MAKTSESLVAYGDFTLEDAEADTKDMEQGGGGNIFVKFKVGKTKLRFIPPLPERKWRRVTYVHYVDIPGGDRAIIVCPRYEKKERCILCEMEKQLWERTDANEAKNKLGPAEADRKKAKKIKAKRRCYANVIDRANPENGPMVVGFGQTVEEALVEMRKDEEDGGNFLHPVDGFDIKIARKGTTQLDTEYEVIKSTECPLSEDVAQVNEWIKGQHNLERFCKTYSNKDIEKILKGEKPGDDDDDDDEDKPAPKKVKSTVTKSKKTV